MGLVVYVCMCYQIAHLPYPEIQEGALSVLAAAVQGQHANCRRVLHSTTGLETLITIAEGRMPGDEEDQDATGMKAAYHACVAVVPAAHTLSFTLLHSASLCPQPS